MDRIYPSDDAKSRLFAGFEAEEEGSFNSPSLQTHLFVSQIVICYDFSVGYKKLTRFCLFKCLSYVSKCLVLSLILALNVSAVRAL